jgi:hypothetical protein
MRRHYLTDDSAGNAYWAVSTGSSDLKVMVQIGSQEGDEASIALTPEQAEHQAVLLLEKAAEARAARARYEALLTSEGPLSLDDQFRLLNLAIGDIGAAGKDFVRDRVPDALARLAAGGGDAPEEGASDQGPRP